MNFKPQHLAALTGLGLLALVSQTVSAGTVSCPGTAATDDREFTLTTDPTGSCLAFGAGNISGNGDAINALGYITLDKSDDITTGASLGTEGALSGTSNGSPSGLTTGTSGTFTIDLSKLTGFTSFVIAFKTGQGQLDPDWAAFSFPAGVFTGSWTISGQQALSHANLYGKQAVVPIPAAAWLFGSALLGIAGLGYRRKRSA